MIEGRPRKKLMDWMMKDEVEEESRKA